MYGEEAIKEQIKDILMDIEIDPEWNTGFSGNAASLNTKSKDEAVDKLAKLVWRYRPHRVRNKGQVARD